MGRLYVLDVVTASLKFYHLFALWASLPALGFCNFHELLDVLIVKTETSMLLLLACDTRFLGTLHACGYACCDVAGSDPFGAQEFAAIRSVRRLQFFTFGHISSEERGR